MMSGVPHQGFFTGRYVHNLHMSNNSLLGNCGADPWTEGPEKDTVAVSGSTLGCRAE